LYSKHVVPFLRVVLCSYGFVLHGGGSKYVDLVCVFFFGVLLVLFFVSSRFVSGETCSVSICSVFWRGCFVLGAW
jgi:hypothetical protein